MKRAVEWPRAILSASSCQQRYLLVCAVSLHVDGDIIEKVWKQTPTLPPSLMSDQASYKLPLQSLRGKRSLAVSVMVKKEVSGPFMTSFLRRAQQKKVYTFKLKFWKRQFFLHIYDWFIFESYQPNGWFMVPISYWFHGHMLRLFHHKIN